MQLDWQNVAVLVIVAGAAIYVSRLAWLTLARKKTAACGGCKSCAADGVKQVGPVIEIAPLGTRSVQQGGGSR